MKNNILNLDLSRINPNNSHSINQNKLSSLSKTPLNNTKKCLKVIFIIKEIEDKQEKSIIK